jgi:hypothetical protein
MVAKPASIRTPATDCPSNIHGRYVLSRRILPRSRLPVVWMHHHVRTGWVIIPIHRMPAGRARLIADDGRRRAVSLNRLSAHRAHVLEPPPALRRRRPKWWPQTLRQLSSISLGNSFGWILPIHWILPANAAFLAFVPGREVRLLEIETGKKVAWLLSGNLCLQKSLARAGARRRGRRGALGPGDKK